MPVNYFIASTSSFVPEKGNREDTNGVASAIVSRAPGYFSFLLSKIGRLRGHINEYINGKLITVTGT